LTRLGGLVKPVSEMLSLFRLQSLVSFTSCLNPCLFRTPVADFLYLVSESMPLSDSSRWFPLPRVRIHASFGLQSLIFFTSCPNPCLFRTPVADFLYLVSESMPLSDSSRWFPLPRVRIHASFGLQPMVSLTSCPNPCHFRTPADGFPYLVSESMPLSDSSRWFPLPRVRIHASFGLQPLISLTSCPNPCLFRTPADGFPYLVSESMPLSDSSRWFPLPRVRIHASFGLQPMVSFTSCLNPYLFRTPVADFLYLVSESMPLSDSSTHKSTQPRVQIHTSAPRTMSKNNPKQIKKPH
jgi:hypothetical protein